MSAATRKAQALAARKAKIAALRACDCTWPLDVYRNGSGHGEDCPVHEAYVASRRGSM